MNTFSQLLGMGLLNIVIAAETEFPVVAGTHSFVTGVAAEGKSKDAEEVEQLKKQLRDGVLKKPLDREAVDSLACLLAKHNLPESRQALRGLLLADAGKWGGSFLFISEYLNRYPERTAKELIPLLKDGDAKVRARAATVLADFWLQSRMLGRKTDEKYLRVVPDLAAESKELVENLRSNLRDKDQVVRWASAEALIATKLPVAAEVIPLVVSWLKEESPPINKGISGYFGWHPASRILAADPGCAAPLILAAVPNADAAAQARMAEAMSIWPIDALQPHLAKALQADDKRLRHFAITVVHALRWKNEPVIAALVPQLTMVLDDPETTLRIEAADLLIGAGVDRDRLVRVLTKGLEEKESALRLRSIELLRRMGKSSLAASPALQKALKDGEPRVRLSASAALVALDPAKASSAVPVLLAIVADANSPYRLEAAEALLQVDPTQTEPALRAVQEFIPKMKTTENEEWRAMHVVRLLGPAAKPIVPEMLKTFEKAKSHRRISWAVTIAMVDPKAKNQAEAYVRQTLIGKNEDDREDVLYQLESVGRGAKVFLPDLTTILTTSKNNGNIANTILVLSAIGPEAKETLPLLRTLLNSQSNAVRYEAARAITIIETKEKK